VNDGSQTATISMLDQYVQANFAMHADGQGGTLITDPPALVQGADAARNARFCAALPLS
jgi:hypothetical protein